MIRWLSGSALLLCLVALWPGATRAHAAPGANCGPDQATAVQNALAKYPSDPATGWKWSNVPQASNYDPCADLSTVLVSVDGATGSSPEQALMFHRGNYVGTGTPKAYPFTSLVARASTHDTVVLSYASGQTCTACDDGKVTTVRYRWDGNGVQMLDPAPPAPPSPPSPPPSPQPPPPPPPPSP
jgi:hypothetical protein